jgi:hypothetical protein
MRTQVGHLRGPRSASFSDIAVRQSWKIVWLAFFGRRLPFFWTAIYGFVFWDRNQSVSDEFDGLDATEKAGIGATLNRCRVLASKIGNELRNKKPEHFVDKLSLADIHASLERAADVLSMVEGSRARGHQRRQ